MLKHLRLLVLSLLASTILLGQSTPVSSIRIATSSPGARFYVDGQGYSAPAVFLWPAGSKHTVQFPTLSNNGADTGCQWSNDQQFRFCFNGWVDQAGASVGNAAKDQTVTASTSLTALIANVTLTYQIHVRFGTFPGAGTAECASPGNAAQDVIRPGIIYIAGTCFQTATEAYAGGQITLNAFPYPGFVFTGWNINGQILPSYISNYTVTGPATIMAIFEPAKRVRFSTNPPGLKLLIDRTTTPTGQFETLDNLSPSSSYCSGTVTLPPAPPVTVPALCTGEFDFLPGSKHTIGAVTPQMDQQGKWWVFDKFSNGLDANAAYVTDLNTAVADRVVANFVPGVQAMFLTNPVGLPLDVDGRSNWPSYTFIWAANSTHTALAADSQVDSNGRRWQFQGWSNGGTASQTFTLDASQTGLIMTANYKLLGQLTLATNPPGIKLSIDGRECTSPCTVDRDPGTPVSVQAPVSVGVDENTRMDLTGWSDGGGATRSLVVGVEAQVLTANYGYAFRLTLLSDPDHGSDFLTAPASSDLFYPVGTDVTVTANARAGYKFRRWSGDAAGVYNVAPVRLSGPKWAVANLDKVPYIAPAGVRNAAGETPVAAVAPGSIVTIYGESLAAGLVVGSTNPLQQTLGDVVVTVGERILPLLYVSPQQINAQLPPDLADGNSRLTVRWTGQPDVTAEFTVARNAPGIFGQDGGPGGTRYASARHADGSSVGPGSPVKRGELITLLGTGFGPYTKPVLEGFAATTANATLSDTAELLLGDSIIVPEWCGASQETAGTVLVRFRVPQSMNLTGFELRARVNGKLSNTVLLPVE